MYIIADDFSLDTQHDAVILELFKSQIINAASAMVIFKDFTLTNMPLGLHITLCLSGTRSYKTLSGLYEFYPTYKNLILKSLKCQEFKKFVKEEIHSQRKEFIKRYKREPAYIDFHMNVQHNPFIYPIILAEINKLGFKLRIHHKVSYKENIKNNFYNILGTICFFLFGKPKYLLNNKISSNFNFRKNLNQKDDIFYCHPGINNKDTLKKDRYTQREREVDKLRS